MYSTLLNRARGGCFTEPPGEECDTKLRGINHQSFFGVSDSGGRGNVYITNTDIAFYIVTFFLIVARLRCHLIIGTATLLSSIAIANTRLAKGCRSPFEGKKICRRKKKKVHASSFVRHRVVYCHGTIAFLESCSQIMIL